MSDSIDDIFSPHDNVGWSSAGIYSFWDYTTKEILYIGLARDLAVRFKQHNGLLRVPSSSSKLKQITKYFESNEKLGYAILAQSSLSQPKNQRNEPQFRKLLQLDEHELIGNYAGKEGIDYIVDGEGLLIESFHITTGMIPRWNKIGGAIKSRESATEGNYHNIIKAFSSGDTSNPLVSKSTLRELSSNATYELFEVQLHGVRILMLARGFSFNEALDFQLRVNKYYPDIFKRIKEEKYYKKKLSL